MSDQQRRSRCKLSCTYCREAKVSCSDQRPCPRCQERGLRKPRLSSRKRRPSQEREELEVQEGQPPTKRMAPAAAHQSLPFSASALSPLERQQQQQQAWYHMMLLLLQQQQREQALFHGHSRPPPPPPHHGSLDALAARAPPPPPPPQPSPARPPSFPASVHSEEDLLSSPTECGPGVLMGPQAEQLVGEFGDVGEWGLEEQQQLVDFNCMLDQAMAQARHARASATQQEHPAPSGNSSSFSSQSGAGDSTLHVPPTLEDPSVPERFERALKEYRHLFGKLMAFHKSIRVRPYTLSQREHMSDLFRQINEKREELRNISSGLRLSEVCMPSWEAMSEEMERSSKQRSPLSRQMDYALGNMFFPAFVTCVGIVLHGNKQFQELLEISDEMVTSRSCHLTDLLCPEENDGVISFMSKLYSGEFAEVGPCAMQVTMLSFRSKRRIPAVAAFRPFRVGDSSRQSVIQIIPNVKNSMQELIEVARL